MRIETDDGVEILCLPDCAECLAAYDDGYAEYNPMYMDRCPCHPYQNCHPNSCDYYFENWAGES